MNMFNNALLKECRKNKGLTQYDASKIIGVARTTYADYENGKILPPIDKIRKICEWLDMPLEMLMCSDFKADSIKRIEGQADIINTLDDIAQTVRKMKIKDAEKDLIINLLAYISDSYMLRASDFELYDRLKREKENG